MRFDCLFYLSVSTLDASDHSEEDSWENTLATSKPAAIVPTAKLASSIGSRPRGGNDLPDTQDFVAPAMPASAKPRVEGSAHAADVDEVDLGLTLEEKAIRDTVAALDVADEVRYAYMCVHL